MAVKDLAPHIKDLITAYKSMPQSTGRDRVLQSLYEAYLYATSDSLQINLKELEMAGTKSGGQIAAVTNKKKYGSDFYAKIGAKGGKLGRTGGFAAGPEGRERARKYGALGGRLSRRTKASE